MSRRLSALAFAAALAGCGSGYKLFGDDGFGEDECPRPEVGCVDTISLDVADELALVDRVAETVVAQGGLIGIRVSGAILDAPEVEAAGGEVVGVEGGWEPVVIIRALEEKVVVEVVVDGQRATTSVRSAPVERIALVPDEDPFLRAAEPVDFAVVRADERALVVRLLSAEGEMLVDRSLVAEGPFVIEQPAWDRVLVDATESSVVDLVADSVATELTIDVVDPDPIIDEIVPVAGPGLVDPTQPVQDPLAMGATACFLGRSGGVAVSGLAWRIDHGPDAIGESTGCELMFLYPATRRFRMWAGEVARAFQLHVEQ